MTTTERPGNFAGYSPQRVGMVTKLGVPSPETTRARERAYTEVRDALAETLQPGGLRVSPLGPAWSSDVDAHVTIWPDSRELRGRGWLPLDALLAKVGSRCHGRWAVVVDGSVVGAADLHLSPPPDPVEAVLSRCRRQGRAGPREAAELAALARAGYVVASMPPRRRLRELRARVGTVRRHLRPAVVVAVSGASEGGSRALSERFLTDLHLAGVPHGRGRVRPPARRKPARSEVEGGISGVGWLRRFQTNLSALWSTTTIRTRHLLAAGVVVYDIQDNLVPADKVRAGLLASTRLQRRLLPAIPMPHIVVRVDGDAAGLRPRRPRGRFVLLDGGRGVSLDSVAVLAELVCWAGEGP